MEKSEFNKLFGKHVKMMRLDRGWSQRDLAAKLGNNYQNISELERGQFSPSLHLTYRLCNSFEITITEFLSEFNVTFDRRN